MAYKLAADIVFQIAAACHNHGVQLHELQVFASFSREHTHRIVLQRWHSYPVEDKVPPLSLVGSYHFLESRLSHLYKLGKTMRHSEGQVVKGPSYWSILDID